MKKLLPLVGLTVVATITQAVEVSTLETSAFPGLGSTEACDSNLMHQIFGNDLLHGIVPTVAAGGVFVDSIDVDEIRVLDYGMYTMDKIDCIWPTRIDLCHRGRLDCFCHFELLGWSDRDMIILMP